MKKSLFPANWQEYTIADCLRRIEHPVDVDPTTLYTQIGIRSHGKGLFYKEPVTGESLGNKAVYWIEPDCFILNIVFAWEQAISKTTQAEVGMIGSHRFPMYKPVDNIVDIDYLIFYLLTKRGTDILEAASPGGAGRNRTLGQDRFLRSKIMLPPIAEQKKIAAILTTQDKVIELKEKRLAEKQRQKKYLMQQLLTGKKRLNGFEGEWSCVKFDTLFEILPNNTYSREFMTTDNGTIHNIHYGDILVKYGSIIDFSQQDVPYLTDATTVDSSSYLCDGDIIIADTAEDLSAGKAVEIYGLNGQKAVAGLHTMAWRPITADCVPKWLGFYMSSDAFHDQIKPLICGTKVSSISKKEIVKTTIAIPTKGEQEAIIDILTSADNELSLLQQDLDQEKQKKKALMQLLLTGKARV